MSRDEQVLDTKVWFHPDCTIYLDGQVSVAAVSISDTHGGFFRLKIVTVLPSGNSSVVSGDCAF